MITKSATNLLMILTLLLAGGQTHAQQNRMARGEVGLMLGGSNYHGDLAYNIVWDETHPAAGFFARYNLSRYWSWKSALSYGKISGSDENFSEYKLRNLSFQSHLWEISSVLEFSYLPFGSNVLNEDFTTYLFLGVAAFRFNPTAEYNGTRYDLRDLRTEGQSSGQSYGIVQISMPFGGGFKYSMSENWVFGWEIGWRKTWTDYLDDVSTTYPDLIEQREKYGNLSANMSDRSFELTENSLPLANKGDQRGDPNFNDYYFFSTVSLAYRFTPIVCWPRYRRGYSLK